MRRPSASAVLIGIIASAQAEIIPVAGVVSSTTATDNQTDAVTASDVTVNSTRLAEEAVETNLPTLATVEPPHASQVENRIKVAPKAVFTNSGTNGQALYSRWPAPQAVPYLLDPTYTQQDQTDITAAMNQITADMQNCIRFTALTYPTTQAAVQALPQDFLFIRPRFSANNTNIQTCLSFPGRRNSQGAATTTTTGTVIKGQLLGMIRGQNGCIGNMRDAMKVLVNALGLRDEFRRQERITVIQTVNTQNLPAELQALNLFGVYNPPATGLNVFLQGTAGFDAVDTNSITWPLPTRYVTTGQLYTPVNGQVLNQNLQARLSQRDCQALGALYASTCAAIQCADPYTPANPPAAPPAAAQVNPLVNQAGTNPVNPVNPVVPGTPVIVPGPGGGPIVVPPGNLP